MLWIIQRQSTFLTMIIGISLIAGGTCDYCWYLSFFGFLRLDLSPWGCRNRYFLVAFCRLIVRRPNLKVATNRPLHQQVKIPVQFYCHVAHRSVSLQLFPIVWVFLRSLGVNCYDRWVLSDVHKNYYKDWCLMKSQLTFLFLTYF